MVKSHGTGKVTTDQFASIGEDVVLDASMGQSVSEGDYPVTQKTVCLVPFAAEGIRMDWKSAD